MSQHDDEPRRKAPGALKLALGTALLAAPAMGCAGTQAPTTDDQAGTTETGAGGETSPGADTDSTASADTTDSTDSTEAALVDTDTDTGNEGVSTEDEEEEPGVDVHSRG